MALQKTYTKNEAVRWPYPNYWDIIALCLVLGGIFLLAWGAKQMASPYHFGQSIAISLDPKHLPYYALRTVLRMFIALACSLIFTLIFATWASKSKYAERIIIPLIDILQSVPILGFLAIISTSLINLFHGSMLGPELVAIFATFTAQAWNIALSFYQSLKSVPNELKEAANMLKLSPWQKFWRMDVPFSMPGLLWNMMLSMSASWFFVVAAEAFTVAGHQIMLPGIGSYIALAIQHANKAAVVYAIIAMFLVILLYDQLLFRPLVSWAEKFKAEQLGEEHPPSSWVVDLFQKTRLFPSISLLMDRLWDNFVNFRWFNHQNKYTRTSQPFIPKIYFVILSYSLFFLLVIIALGGIVHTIFTTIAWREILYVLFLGAITGAKVMILILLCSLVWIPIGVWIGLHDRLTEITQPIIQFLAAFPAILLFPIVVMAIVKYNLNVNIWTAPLMVLGTQWYILFNVIAGTNALPKDLKQASANLHLKGWLWWKRFILPGIFPYFLTGAITAAGGAWNVSIVAEVVSWGNKQFSATGLGAYITHNFASGDFSRLALGIGIMTLYVILMNRILWRPLYNFAAERFQ